MTITTRRPLTDDERIAFQHHMDGAQDAFKNILLHEDQFGRHVRAIRDSELYRDHGTFGQFIKGVFGRSKSWAYQCIELADVNDDLARAGADPLAVRSHAGVIIAARTPELRALITERGREMAEEDGAGLTANHLKAAKREVLAGLEATAGQGPAQGADERAAVRSYTGLVVALSTDAVLASAAPLATLPGKVVVPYDDSLVYPPLSERATGASPFGLAKIDGITDIVWTVLAPDPWTAAVSWAAPSDRFHGVFYPDRLSAPQSRQKRDPSDREATVLIAPGVDLFHPEVPDRVVREVITAAAADPGRRYLLRTDHPSRAWQDEWPANVFVVVEAVGTAAAVDAASLSLGNHDYLRAIIIRDLVEPIPPMEICAFYWVLVRGAKTTQEAYESILKAVDADMAFDRGDEVKARHSSYPALSTSGSDPA